MADPTPHWSANEDAGAHPELENLARLIFESGGLLPDVDEVGEEAIQEALAVQAVAVEGGRVDFANPETRDDYLARHTAARASEEWNRPNQLVNLLTSAQTIRVRLGASRDLVATVLRILWETHDRDILGLITDLARDEASAGHDFWSLYGDFCKVLPEIEVDANELADALNDIAEATAGDLAGGLVYQAVERLASRSATGAADLITAFLDRSGSPAISFALSALVGLFTVDAERAHQWALECSRAAEADVRRVGVAALGRFPYEADAVPLLAATSERFAELRTHGHPGIDHVLIRAHSDLLDHAPELRNGLEELTRRKDARSRHEIARALMAWRETETDERWWRAGLHNLTQTPGEETGTLKRLDHALATAAEVDPNVALGFFERFFSERSEEALIQIDISDLFPMTSRFLHTSGKEQLQAAITRWFGSTAEPLHRLAHDFVQAHRSYQEGDAADDLILDLTELRRLDHDTIVHALRRILGWVLGGRPLAALLVSALERDPEDPASDPIGEFVAHQLTEFVLYNYPSDTGDFLRARVDAANGTRVGRVIEKALDQSNQYYNALSRLPSLPELWPSERRLNLIAQSHGSMQSRIMEQARRRSPILDLVHRVPLKYGRSVFSRDEEGRFSTPTALTSFSHEVEIPRGEVINPVGIAFYRLAFRLTGVDQEDHEAGKPQ